MTDHLNPVSGGAITPPQHHQQVMSPNAMQQVAAFVQQVMQPQMDALQEQNAALRMQVQQAEEQVQRAEQQTAHAEEKATEATQAGQNALDEARAMRARVRQDVRFDMLAISASLLIPTTAAYGVGATAVGRGILATSFSLGAVGAAFDD